ncbi:uncharacterized protein LOC121810441 [Salvia splendens]|uniref:uncharacterized protein LOC121810441 n=1 Tax=Salvia splendens TaxID=180675 RepID=UPI001C272728|nr:uncharacterized protein LOC121810441 [Salvia splendens]
MFGNILQNLKDAEQAVLEAQAIYDSDPTPAHRADFSRVSAELIITAKMEEEFWRQKAAIKWATDGERNSKFFHGWVRQKRVKSRIHTVEEKEVKDAVFGISGDSVSGPDGFTSLFFQHCWDTVGRDVSAAVGDFFSGAFMPRSFTATMIVLIPKKPNPVTWGDFRPISLCNVTNKIITKILASRLAPLLPLVIAPNQSGFIKGRLLSDNALLAQELINDLGKELSSRGRSPNLALKLDMAKAYDRVQWPFLLKVLDTMGFSQTWVDMIRRCISSCWFSVLVNGGPAGFFQSSRGLRQEDPLSPSLFVLAADYLSRCLDRLIKGDREMVYRCRKKAPIITHLSYADDIIIFSRAHREAVEKLVGCLDHYIVVSGQLVNNGKTHFFLANEHMEFADVVEEVGGFQRGAMPFTYLGVPIFRGARRADHLLPLRQRLMDKIHSWSHRHLAFGGRLALIKSTLAAIPLHILQVMSPLLGFLDELEQILARYFWGTVGEKRKLHWISWRQICLPFDEGGLGIRRFREVAVAFGFKLWWRLLAQDSLWAKFMTQKYSILPCHLHTSPCWSHDSPTWRRLRRIWSYMHENIRWSLGEGKISFWDDVWLGTSSIRNLCVPGNDPPQSQAVVSYWHEYAWDGDMLHSLSFRFGVPLNVIDQIRATPIELGAKDVRRWSLTSHGEFSVTSAWESIRTRLPKREIFGLIWNQGLAPTMSVFIWRLLFGRLPVDEKLQRRGIELASRCQCCRSPWVESLSHVFLSSQSAIYAWEYFNAWFPSSHTPIHTSTDIALRLGHSSSACASFGRQDHLDSLEGCSPSVDFMSFSPRQRVLRSLMVLWHPPDAPWVKLNTDGAFSTSTLAAGEGGLGAPIPNTISYGIWEGVAFEFDQVDCEVGNVWFGEGAFVRNNIAMIEAVNLSPMFMVDPPGLFDIQIFTRTNALYIREGVPRFYAMGEAAVPAGRVIAEQGGQAQEQRQANLERAVTK